MALHSYSIYAETTFLQGADKPHYRLTAPLEIHTIVIIIQLRLRVCLVSKLECKGNELLTQYLVVERLTITAVPLYGFVHDIPTLDLPTIMTCHGIYVATHTLNESFARHFTTDTVTEHP